MSSISSSASSRSIIFIATTVFDLLSSLYIVRGLHRVTCTFSMGGHVHYVIGRVRDYIMPHVYFQREVMYITSLGWLTYPLNTSPNEPFPIFSCFVNRTSGSTSLLFRFWGEEGRERGGREGRERGGEREEGREGRERGGEREEREEGREGRERREEREERERGEKERREKRRRWKWERRELKEGKKLTKLNWRPCSHY